MPGNPVGHITHMIQGTRQICESLRKCSGRGSPNVGPARLQDTARRDVPGKRPADGMPRRGCRSRIRQVWVVGRRTVVTGPPVQSRPIRSVRDVLPTPIFPATTTRCLVISASEFEDDMASIGGANEICRDHTERMNNKGRLL